MRRIGSVATFFKGDHKPVPIVWDGALASAIFGEGRIIPFVLIDTGNRPDVEKMLAAHGKDAGVVHRVWGRHLFFGRDKVRLVLTFEKPNPCTVVLAFQIDEQGVIVEQILHAQSLFIRSGKPGDKFITTEGNPGVLVDIPFDEVFWDAWVDLYDRYVYRRMRRQGLTHQEARDFTNKFISSWRGAFHKRMKLGSS